VFTVTGERQQLEVDVNSEEVSVNSECCVFKARVGS